MARSVPRPLLVLALAIGGRDALAQAPPADAAPAAVVQHFVDAANRRDLDGMMAVVAPEAVFAALPTGRVLAADREAVRARYRGYFARLAGPLAVEVVRRITDGVFVVDRERIVEGGNPERQAIWVYEVRGGLIRHAWVLEQPPPGP